MTSALGLHYAGKMEITFGLTNEDPAVTIETDDYQMSSVVATDEVVRFYQDHIFTLPQEDLLRAGIRGADLENPYEKVQAFAERWQKRDFYSPFLVTSRERNFPLAHVHLGHGLQNGEAVYALVTRNSSLTSTHLLPEMIEQVTYAIFQAWAPYLQDHHHKVRSEVSGEHCNLSLLAATVPLKSKESGVFQKMLDQTPTHESESHSNGRNEHYYFTTVGEMRALREKILGTPVVEDFVSSMPGGSAPRPIEGRRTYSSSDAREPQYPVSSRPRALTSYIESPQLAPKEGQSPVPADLDLGVGQFGLWEMEGVDPVQSS